MSLAGMQTVLGRAIREGLCAEALADAPATDRTFHLTAHERMCLQSTLTSPGFLFTVAVQRSWCEGRAATTARQTLSVLPATDRQRLLGDWVARGAGTSSFVAGEAEAFLEFVANRLPAPSHVHTMCRLEQAAYRASSQVGPFVASSAELLFKPGAAVRTGRWAGMVPFYVEPEEFMAALHRSEVLPANARPCAHLLFAPGLPGLFRRASNREVRLWASLARPTALNTLALRKPLWELLSTMLAAGAIDVDQVPGG